MPLIEKIKNLLKNLFKVQDKTVIYDLGEAKEPEKFVSIWDYLLFRENTQAMHLSKVIGFEEWVSMREILRRIEELFNAKYQNEKSLYPYLKSLTDIGLFETSDVGGTRKWRKREILIKLLPGKQEEKETEKASRIFA